MKKPKTRADCENIPRPCPYVTCKYNNYVDIVNGKVVYNFPDLEPNEVPACQSCALDVAENGGMMLEEIGSVFSITREGMRLAIKNILRKLIRK